MDDDRTKALADIKENINKHGYHVYFVSGGATPDYAYTVGLYERYGLDIVMAGCCYFSVEDVSYIIKTISGKLPDIHDESLTAVDDIPLEIEEGETFFLRKVHHSWSSRLLLGALDYYGRSELDVLQIVPPDELRTIDVPDLSVEFSPAAEAVWQWLDDGGWNYKVPEDSTALTNLRALRGEPINQIVRWSESEWDLFVGGGSDALEADKRTVSLAIFLGRDAALAAVCEQLSVGTALWRDDGETDWEPLPLS